MQTVRRRLSPLIVGPRLKTSSSIHRKFAVDIGNSGARIVALPDTGDVLPEPLRINWQFVASDGSTSAQAETSSRKGSSHDDGLRFRPDQSEWVERLRSIADFGSPTQSPSTHSRTQWWISSVNRPASEVLQGFLAKQVNCEVHWINYQSLPMSVEVDYPARVGIDRLLAALAACHFCDQNRLIVIQAGSAVTVDLVERTGASSFGKPFRFSGGAILPGVPMMLQLLGRAADMLPEIDANDLVNLPELPGKNTEAAMVAGCSSCLVGGVQHLVERYRKQFGLPLPIILSGGDGPLLAPHLSSPITMIPQLVMQGIRILACSSP